MKYLVYFKPDDALAELILNHPHVLVPNSGLHGTLCNFYMEPTKESDLIRRLSEIQFAPMEVETGGFADYDDGALVLELSRPQTLLELHEKIVACVKKYAEAGFDEKCVKYFGKRYHPHITMSTSSSLLNREKTGLSGRKIRISEYHLARKTSSGWEQREAFRSANEKDMFL